MRQWVVEWNDRDEAEFVFAEELKIQDRVATFYVHDTRPGAGTASQVVSSVYALKDGMIIREITNG